MSPRPDIDALLPDDAARRARRDALVAELRPATGSDAAASTPHDAGAVPGRSVPHPGTTGSPVLTRRRLVHAGLIGGGALAVGLVGTTVIPGTDGSPVDVLGSARAAAAPVAGGILHTAVRFGSTPDPGPAHLASRPLSTTPAAGQVFGTIGHTTERWTADGPFREHVVRHVTIDGRDAPARDETSYDAGDGTFRRRSFAEPDVVRVERVTARTRALKDRERRRALRPTLTGVADAADPVAALRELLNSSILRPDGGTEVDGRAVRRLVGRDPGRPVAGARAVPPLDVEVLVDADDFTPVRITTSFVLGARPDAEEPAARRSRTLRATWTFERYERLPLNAETAGLLEVDTTGRRIVRDR